MKACSVYALDNQILVASQDENVKILFVIRSLERGGAERQLCMLAKELCNRGHQVEICTFYRSEGYGALLDDTNVTVRSLDKTTRWNVLGVVFRFFRMLYVSKPMIIHGYLPTGNILAALGRIVLPHAKIVFGVRAATMHLEMYDRFSRWVYAVERKLSSHADLVIANSDQGAEIYRAFGANTVVIYNGIDTEHFRPDKGAGEDLGKSWAESADQIIVGMVARIDPIKDHETFFRAAKILLDQGVNVKFVCIGGGSPIRRESLKQIASDLGITKHLVWAGEISNMLSCYNALDIITLASKGEGFPNVIAEAMACGVLPVASRVGGVPNLIGDTGWVVPVGDAIALRDAWLEILSLDEEEKKRMIANMRSKILEKYSVGFLAQNTETILGVGLKN